MVSDITFFKCIDDAVQLHTKHDNEPVYYYMYSHRGQYTLASFYGDLEVDYGELIKIHFIVFRHVMVNFIRCFSR